MGIDQSRDRTYSSPTGVPSRGCILASPQSTEIGPVCPIESRAGMLPLVGREDADAPGAHADPSVLEVDATGPVGDVQDECNRAKTPPYCVQRVPVEIECLAIVDSSEGLNCGSEVVVNLEPAHLLHKSHFLGVEQVENRSPPPGEVFAAAIDEVLADRWEHRHVPPNALASESDGRVDPELASHHRGHLHLLGRALTYTLHFPMPQTRVPTIAWCQEFYLSRM